MNIKGLVAWIIERQAIYERRVAGQPKPWTKDVILRDFKFCNVYREQDKTTVWIKNNWRDPGAKQEDLWFAMVVARLLNRPSTLEALGFPVPWRPQQFIKLVHARKAAGVPAFSGAYMISTHGRKADKAEFLAGEVLTPLWKARTYIRPRADDTLSSFHARLTEHFGMGSFLGAQVVADVKYTSQLAPASDWWTWASSGPGSRRGLNRVCGRDVGAAWAEDAWRNALGELRVTLTEDKAFCKARDKGLPPIHAQDLQNCLCEYDKYQRVRLGEGRMKATYDGGV